MPRGALVYELEREKVKNMKRRDFCKGVSVQALAATALPSVLLASDDIRIEEVDEGAVMDQSSDIVDLFVANMKLCKVREGETFLFYSTPGYARPEYIEASLAAAKSLGANAFSLVANGAPSVATTRTARDIAPADLLKDTFIAADIVFGEIPLYTAAHNAALDSGTRTLMVGQGVETLRRMFPDEDVIRRTYAGAARMETANEIRVTDDHGSDFTLRKDGRKGHAQVGISADRGRWDHWPSGLVACGPLEDRSEGIYVVRPGDILLGLSLRCQDEIRITLEGGRLTKIEGGYDAATLRDRLELFEDYRDPDGHLADPFRIAHAGWGTEHRAQWQYLGMDSESMYGSLMVSIGRNMFNSSDRWAGLGGTNYTPVHIDICCRNKNLYLDGDLIVDQNKIIPPRLA